MRSKDTKFAAVKLPSCCACILLCTCVCVHQCYDMFSDSVRGRRESVFVHKRASASASARERDRLIDRERKRLCSYMYKYVTVHDDVRLGAEQWPEVKTKIPSGT